MKINTILKNLTLCGGLLHLFQTNSQAQWTPVGNVGFSSTIAGNAKLVVDSITPYVVYYDNSNTSNYGMVEKFNGTAWEPVAGGVFQYNNALSADMKIVKHVPYIVHRGANSSTFRVVLKTPNAQNTLWTEVGGSNATIDTKYPRTTKLAFSQATPYVAYDYTTSGRVKYFKNNLWNQLGTSFSHSSTFVIRDLELAISPNSPNDIYVAYTLENDSLSVAKYSTSTQDWVQIGKNIAKTPSSNKLKLLVDSTNTPYVLFSNSNNSNHLALIKYSNNTWNSVGNPDISKGACAYHFALTMVGSQPYVAFLDSISNKASVRTLKGNDWVYFSTPGFSAGVASDISIAAGKDNSIYVGYSDQSVNGKITVQKAKIGVVITEIEELSFSKPSIYPNPSNENLFLTNIWQFDSYEIMNLNGIKLQEGKLVETSSISVIDLNKGTYLLVLKNSQAKQVVKFVKL